VEKGFYDEGNAAGAKKRERGRAKHDREGGTAYHESKPIRGRRGTSWT